MFETFAEMLPPQGKARRFVLRMPRNQYANYCCPCLFQNQCAEAEKVKLFNNPYKKHCYHCGGRLFKLFREKTAAQQAAQKRKFKLERHPKRAQEVRETLQR